MIWKASARSVWYMPRHGQNEQEALARMARNGLVARDPTDLTDKQRAWVSGISSQSKLFYLWQISEKG
jgi:hypothetical protein